MQTICGRKEILQRKYTVISAEADIFFEQKKCDIFLNLIKKTTTNICIYIFFSFEEIKPTAKSN